MKLSKTIKKAEKLSGSKIQISGNLHFVNYKGYNISFYPNGRISDDVESTNFYTIKHGLSNDLNCDYFPGTFHDNLAQAFKFIDRKF